MYGDSQIERLQSAAALVSIREGTTHPVEDVTVSPDALADDQRLGFHQRLVDAFAAGHLPCPRASGAIGENDNVASEERAMRAAEIEQHAVLTGDRYDSHRSDDRSI
jgi:hypothetical protein